MAWLAGFCATGRWSYTWAWLEIWLYMGKVASTYFQNFSVRIYLACLKPFSVTVHVVLRYTIHKTALLIIPIHITCSSFSGLFNWCLNFWLVVKSNTRQITSYLDDVYVYTYIGLLCHVTFLKIIAWYGSYLCFWHQVEYKSCMRFQMFTVALLKVKVFLDVMLSSSRCSGGS